MAAERKKPIPRKIITDPLVRWLLLGLVVSIFVMLLFPNLVVQRHRYVLGDIVEQDIKAPQDFFIEDKPATDAIRQKAANQVLTVYDHDPRIVRQLIDNIRKAFADRRQAIQRLERQNPAVESPGSNPPVLSGDLKVALDNELLAQKPVFEAALGIEISQGAYKILMSEDFSQAISESISKVLYDIYANGVVANKELLLKDNDRGITVRNVVSQKENAITALRQYYGPDQARTMVRIVAEPYVKDMSYNLVNLIVDMCQRMVQPNITLNRNETEKRKEAAVQGIKPIMYKFKAGEMLAREGERINANHMLIFKALESQRENRHVASVALGAALVAAIFITMVYVLYLRNSRHGAMNTNRNILFLSMVLLMVLVISKMWVFFSSTHSYGLPLKMPAASAVFSMPAATGAMIVCIFMGLEIALPFSLVASVCLAMLFGNRIEIVVFFLISNAMGAYWVQHCRERKVFITAGLKLGLLNTCMAIIINIYASDFFSLKLLADGALAFTSGLASAIITIGVAPLLEMAFHYTTDITLLELANLDRPILRRLMLEAPGTYHHSVIVGSLVEAAAAEIGANPLLAKVCGYYHDIGKVKKPLYFIENQTNGKNKHDKLAPSMSSLILIAHIKDGIEIARQNKLGQAIVDTIQQHHGTSLISFFFNKAKQLKGAEAVKTDDFRYPGPRPQTIETGLVMLADVVEAASRTLENPTPARIQGLVQHLINKIFSDGQLDNCELTLRDLHSIAKTFNKILNGIHHHRIEYSDTPTKENGKGKHGHPDRQPTVKTAHKGKSDSEDSPGHLKRLGLP
jgi:putative nucleotidyltransferase with HDIG domain